MRLPEQVTMVEVGLRDGLQMEKAIVPTERKIALANAIARAGVPVVEVTSFVHPQVIPQLADAEAVVVGVDRQAGARWAALVPNQKGAVRALAAGVDEVHWVLTASETFNQRNVRMSVQESLAQLAEAVTTCRRTNAAVRLVGGVGTAFGCPYEGDVPASRVLMLIGEMVGLGLDGVTLADTTGMANPLQVARLSAAVRERWPDLEVSLHFHNTRGMGLANLLGGLEGGVTRFEASLGGIGGCPFAPRATGNICTEDTVHMLHQMGVNTGIDLRALLDAARSLEGTLGRELPGQVMKAGACSHTCTA